MRHVHVTQARSPCRFLGMSPPFVPDHFEPPLTLTGNSFQLEPLGPQHNERDHEAWMSSVAWIRSTPGYSPDGDWPTSMSLDSNLKDLEMHARDFEQRSGFTYSVLDGGEIIGCVYIYPSIDPKHDASVTSWVRESRSAMDAPVYQAVAEWIERSWPFQSAQYAPRPSA
jgi:hypothetical protein